MPGLKLTAAQVNRLCNIPKDVCDAALQALTRSGFLQGEATRFSGSAAAVRPEPSSPEPAASPNRLACVRSRLIPIEADPARHRRCDLARRERCVRLPLAAASHGRRRKCHPDVLRTLYFRAVISPILGGSAATMIGCDEQMRAALVSVSDSRASSQLCQIGIGVRIRLENAIVAAVMCPVVRLTECQMSLAAEGTPVAPSRL